MEKAVERGLDWAGLPVIATGARLLCRELTLRNEYLRLENRTLKGKIRGDARRGSHGGVRAVPGRTAELVLPEGRIVSTGCRPQV